MTRMTRIGARARVGGAKNGEKPDTKVNKEPVKDTKAILKAKKKIKEEEINDDSAISVGLADYEELVREEKERENSGINEEPVEVEDEEEEEEEEEDDDDDDDFDDDIADQDFDVEDGDEEEEDDEVDPKKCDKTFKCVFCEYAFTRKSMLKRHMRIHTGERPYKCDKCDARFTQQGGLKNHTLSKHRDDLDQKDKITYQCHHCERSFIIKERLRIHLRVHTGELPYVCHICSKKFRRNGALLQHLRRHVGMRPYTCEICKAAYYNSTNLKTHMKRHLGVQDYVCDLCGKGFTRRDGLRKHVACFHYDQAAFRCSICNKSFKGHILSHLRMHLKEKPFKCEECGMRFVQSSQLVVHKRTHSGAKPYPCLICKVAFSHSSALRMHIRRHTGEKPVKCLLCPAAFVQLPHLKKHMRCIHKTEKPYVCVPCYVFFKTKAELDEHTSANDCKPAPPPVATPSGAKSPVEGATPEEASIPRVEAAMPGEGAVKAEVSTLDDQVTKPTKRNCKRKIEAVTKGDEAVNSKRTSSKRAKSKRAADATDKPNDSEVVAVEEGVFIPSKSPESTKTNHAAASDESSETVNPSANSKPTGDNSNSLKVRIIRKTITRNQSKPDLEVGTSSNVHGRSTRSSRGRGNLYGTEVYEIDRPWAEAFGSDSGLNGNGTSGKNHQAVNSAKKPRARSESPARVSLVTLPICEPLKAVDQPQRSMVEKMMEKVTNRLKKGKGKTTVVMRSQSMSLEKIRMLLAILLIRISTPDRLKALGFGKILIDEVLIASIKSSGRQPCDKTGLSEREVILQNVQILLDWTVPKVYMERFRREKRSTEDLLQELTT